MFTSGIVKLTCILFRVSISGRPVASTSYMRPGIPHAALSPTQYCAVAGPSSAGPSTMPSKASQSPCSPPRSQTPTSAQPLGNKYVNGDPSSSGGMHTSDPRLGLYHMPPVAPANVCPSALLPPYPQNPPYTLRPPPPGQIHTELPPAPSYLPSQPLQASLDPRFVRVQAGEWSTHQRVKRVADARAAAEVAYRQNSMASVRQAAPPSAPMGNGQPPPLGHHHRYPSPR